MTHTPVFFSHWSRTKRFSTERRSFDLYIIYSKAADAATLDSLGKERETILGLPRWYLVFFIERLPSGQADEDAVFQEPSRASRVILNSSFLVIPSTALAKSMRAMRSSFPNFEPNVQQATLHGTTQTSSHMPQPNFAQWDFPETFVHGQWDFPWRT